MPDGALMDESDDEILELKTLVSSEMLKNDSENFGKAQVQHVHGKSL